MKSRQGRRCQEEGTGPRVLPWRFSELIYQENSTCRNLKAFQIVTLCPQWNASGSGVWFGDKGQFPEQRLLPRLQAPVWGDALQTARDSIREKLQAGTLARAGKEQL